MKHKNTKDKSAHINYGHSIVTNMIKDKSALVISLQSIIKEKKRKRAQKKKKTKKQKQECKNKRNVCGSTSEWLGP